MTQLIIVLSTYNGSLYLSAQLDSILQQTLAVDRILIRDDGSTDHTKEILNTYQKNYPQITFIDDQLGNIGIAKSYHLLLQHAENYHPQYIMYADQDDIWLPHKTETLVNLIATTDKSLPALVFSDAQLVDANLAPIADSFLNFQKFPLKFTADFRALLLYSPILGCCTLFNHALLTKILSYSSDLFPYPDKLALIIASSFGKVLQTAEKTILYRQHSTNLSSTIKGIHRGINLDSFYFIQQRFQAAINDAQKLELIIFDMSVTNQQALQDFVLLFTGSLITRLNRYFKFWLIPPHPYRKIGLVLSLLFKFKQG